MHRTVSFTLSVSGFEKIWGAHSALTIILCEQLHCAFAAKWPSEGFLGQGFLKNSLRLQPCPQRDISVIIPRKKGV